MSKLTKEEEILFQAADIIKFVACKHPKTDIIRASATISKLAEELEFQTKTCPYCGGDAALTPIYKNMFKCPRCGAEGETLVSVKKEAKP